MTNVYNLYAVGLGLLFSSIGELKNLGVNGSPVEENDYTELLDNHCAFTLGTGSPELDYEIHVHDSPWESEIEDALYASVKAFLRVKGGALVVRDGYDLDEWLEAPDEIATIPMDDGSYHLTIAAEPGSGHSTMVLHLVAVQNDDNSNAQGTHELIYQPSSNSL